MKKDGTSSLGDLGSLFLVLIMCERLQRHRFRQHLFKGQKRRSDKTGKGLPRNSTLEQGAGLLGGWDWKR